jgi:hypothetical protein
MTINNSSDSLGPAEVSGEDRAGNVAKSGPNRLPVAIPNGEEDDEIRRGGKLLFIDYVERVCVHTRAI